MISNSLSPWPCRVLLVDENDAFLDGLTDWFEGTSEINIIGRAHSPAKAFESVSRLKPDVVLIDTSLPDGNGFDVARSIKTESTPPLVVMMSFLNSDHIRSTASSCGADDCITKADIPENLIHQIEILIKNQVSHTAKSGSEQPAPEHSLNISNKRTDYR